MNAHFPKIVESSHYHIWTDALHAQALAHQARNNWDRGTYVRWAITTAWTAFEMACEKALETPGIGRRFREYLDQAISDKGLPPLDWGGGLWQRVGNIHKSRKEFVHINVSQQRLFAETEESDEAISTLRDATRSIFQHAGKAPPPWVEDNFDPGFEIGTRSISNTTLIHAGGNENDPDAIRVAFDYKGREHITEIYPPNTDPKLLIENLLSRIIIPISAARVYRGKEVIIEKKFQMRGA